MLKRGSAVACSCFAKKFQFLIIFAIDRNAAKINCFTRVSLVTRYTYQSRMRITDELEHQDLFFCKVLNLASFSSNTCYIKFLIVMDLTLNLRVNFNFKLVRLVSVESN